MPLEKLSAFMTYYEYILLITRNTPPKQNVGTRASLKKIMEIVTLQDREKRDDDNEIDDRRGKNPELDDPKSEAPEIDDDLPMTGINENPPPKQKDKSPFPIFPFERIPDLPGVPDRKKHDIEPLDEVN